MADEADAYETERQAVEKIHESRGRIERELAKVIVGQKEATHQLLISLFAGGHCLITGAPGLAKTLLVRTIAQVFHLKFQRIQFTPDLMPADITGTEILEETGEGRRRMQFVKGPIFANVILADEINRTPPKTQAALLEAMQEHQVTAAGVRYPLEEPFFVLATQNPIEMEGTYPAARGPARPLHVQRDRRLPARRRRGGGCAADHLAEDRADRAAVRRPRRPPVSRGRAQGAGRRGAGPPRRPAGGIEPARDRRQPDFVNHWVSWGAGLRAAQSLVLGAKARALLARTVPRRARRHPRPGPPHPAPPHPAGLSGRGRRRGRRRRDRPPSGTREGVRSLMPALEQ